ncbi:hypothetical protein IM792_04855 [Mucilaginibacter sp. JRF]|uniref:hypothetical protein n=1 Tax=Mucilaginibacter sp. JRF TaxID=2780088 RepID=UPI001881CEFE|nr:hypothetical protein [Mucilaginibacter sp. JRF]MBE9583769.1 hypothetical protein [Mucilaginibacter sp. JRF]
MKKLVLLTAAILSIQFAHAQTAKTAVEAPKGSFENFSETAGNKIKQEIFDVANVRGIDFQVLKLTNTTNNDYKAGLRIAARLGSGGSRSSYNTVLDMDELNELQKVIENLTTESIDKTNTFANGECCYMSKGGFLATTFNESGNKMTGYLVLQLKQYRSGSKAYMAAKDLPKLRDAIAAAKVKLQSL